jgi:hypothetical protein
MKNGKHTGTFLAMAALLLVCPFFYSCSGISDGTRSASFTLDLSPLLSARTDGTTTTDAASETYYIKLSAQSVSTTYNKYYYSYEPEKLQEVTITAGAKNACTLTLPNIPLETQIVVTVSIYYENSTDAKYLAATGSTTFIAENGKEISLDMGLLKTGGVYTTLYVNQSSTSNATPTGTADAPYPTLAAAFTAANSMSTELTKAISVVQITLLGDYTISLAGETLSNTVPVILDCGGHTIMNNFNAGNSQSIFTPQEALTLENGTITGGTGLDIAPSAVSSSYSITLANFTINGNLNRAYPVLETTADIYLTNSSITYTNDGTCTADLVKLTGTSSKLYLSGSSTTIAGYTYLASGALISAQTALATSGTIATLDLETAPTYSTPVTVFSSTTNIDRAHWSLASRLCTFASDLTVTRAVVGAMYSGTTTYATGTFDDNGAFTRTATADTTGITYFDTAFDSNGGPYSLWYVTSDSGIVYTLELPNGDQKSISGLPSSTNDGVSGVALTVDEDDSLLLVDVIADNNGTYTDTIYGISYATGSEYAATLLYSGNIASSTSSMIKKIAYYNDGSNKYLFAIDLADESYNLIRTPIQTLSNTASGLTFNSKVYGTISVPFTENADITSIQLDLNDMAIVDGTLYVLGSKVSTSLSSLNSNYSIGSLLKVNPSFTCTDNITDSSSFTSLGISSTIAKTNFVYNSGDSNTTFYGPMRMLAVMPKKIIIADDGYVIMSHTGYGTSNADPYKVALNKIKRTMLYDVSTSTLTAGTTISNYTFSNSSYSAGSYVTIDSPQYTNGVADTTVTN